MRFDGGAGSFPSDVNDFFTAGMPADDPPDTGKPSTATFPVFDLPADGGKPIGAALTALNRELDPGEKIAVMFASACGSTWTLCVTGGLKSRIADNPLDEMLGIPLGGGTFKNAVKRGDGGVDDDTCDAPVDFDETASGDNIADIFAAAMAFVDGPVGAFANIDGRGAPIIDGVLVFCTIDVPVAFDFD